MYRFFSYLITIII